MAYDGQQFYRQGIVPCQVVDTMGAGDSFIAGFELAWKLSVELNHYENEYSVSCRTAMGLGARFASKEEEK